MKIVSSLSVKLPTLKNISLAILSAILLVLAFPDFEIWFLAWLGFIPLFYAVEREKTSIVKSFALGWIFGAIFFFGTCWWLAFPMFHYAGIPSPIAYGLVLLASLTVGLLPAIFAALLSILLKRFGTWAILSAPFLWTATEFLRFYVTGNNWNAIAYSQAFKNYGVNRFAVVGGIYLVSFLTTFCSVFLYLLIGEFDQIQNSIKQKKVDLRIALIFLILFWTIFVFNGYSFFHPAEAFSDNKTENKVIAIQPNVPMSGLKYKDWRRLRERHIQLSEQTLQTLQPTNNSRKPTIIIFPESPMNFEYTRDREFQQFLRDFTAKNNVSVLFNAAEPAADEGTYNSAVLVNERGERIAQYDKIHLLPFGEFVPFPAPIAEFIPPVVGTFEFGKSYDLMPFGDTQAGIMICFESHFPTLSREFVLRGADVLVEMTNDGYLGNTPVLRQHLANTVFRAVETNRPVLRVTNVGITAFINERGEVLDAIKSYTEDTRVWTIAKSDGKQTFYVKYGDWFAWFCTIISLGLLIFSFWKKKQPQNIATGIN